MGDFYGMSPGSNLTGLICAYVMRIEIMDMKPGTQDFSEDLSGFICDYRIVRMDMKL